MEPKKFGGRGARARRQKVGRLPFWCMACTDVSYSYSLTDKSLAGVFGCFSVVTTALYGWRVLAMGMSRWCLVSLGRCIS